VRALEQRLRVLGRAAFRKSGRRPAGRLAVQRELRDREDPAADLTHVAVHEPLIVAEHPQPCHLARGPVGVRLEVLVGGAHQHN
jgi:hypothetical protein